MMLKQLFFFSTFFCSLSADLNPTLYHTHAKRWFETHIQDSNGVLLISFTDLQYIANLLYFSCLRSVSTMLAHEDSTQALQSVWCGCQNIAHTRMNPSVEIPYTINIESQKKIFEKFIQSEYAHSIIGKTYARCAHALVKENFLQTPSAKQAVTKLREDARTIVARSFLDVKKTLGNLYNFASEHMRSNDFEDEDQETYRFDFINSIASYVPYVALTSFVEAEKISLRASEQSWNIVKTINQVSMQVWETIEKARASYYLAHYRLVFEALNQPAIHPKYCIIVFNEDGVCSQELDTLPPL